MRFLLFNIAVIAALAYLFLGERVDLRSLIAVLQAAPASDEDPARIEGNGETLLSQETISVRSSPQAEKDAPAEDVQASDAPGSEAWAALLKDLNAEVRNEDSKDRESVSQRAEAQEPDEGPGESPKNPAGAARLAEGLLPVTDPAVLKRRAEVLEGIDLGGTARDRWREARAGPAPGNLKCSWLPAKA